MSPCDTEGNDNNGNRVNNKVFGERVTLCKKKRINLLFFIIFPFDPSAKDGKEDAGC